MAVIAGLWYIAFVLVAGPVIFASPSKDGRTECEGVRVDECLVKLRTFLRLTALPFPSGQAQLDTLCSDLVAGYNCSVKLWNVPDCLSPRDQGILRVSVDMGQFTMFMFCPTGGENGAYLRDVLLRNSECIGRQKKALECCAEGSTLPEMPVKRVLEGEGKNLFEIQTGECCSVSNYLRCAGAAVLESCGEEAANLTTEYVRRASGEEFEFVCQKMPDYPQLREGVCRDPTPVCSGSRRTPGPAALFGVLLVAATFLAIL